LAANTDVDGRLIIVGAELTLSYKFYTADGVASNPSTISLYLELPSGVIETKDIDDFTKVADGHYEYNADITEGGEWEFTLETTGAPKVVVNGRFVADKKRVKVTA